MGPSDSTQPAGKKCGAAHLKARADLRPRLWLAAVYTGRDAGHKWREIHKRNRFNPRRVERPAAGRLHEQLAGGCDSLARVIPSGRFAAQSLEAARDLV